MKFSDLPVDRPLLALRANDGCRYVIVRHVSTREPWFVSIDPDGGMGVSRVEGLEMGASTSPFDIWVAFGRLPDEARHVEVQLEGKRYDAKARAGVWLVGIPWGNRDLDGVVRFIRRDGGLVMETWLDLRRASPAWRRRNPPASPAPRRQSPRSTTA